jgi:hypothetical protein
MSMRPSDELVLDQLPDTRFFEAPLETRPLGPAVEVRRGAIASNAEEDGADDLDGLVAALDQQVSFDDLPLGPFVRVPRTSKVKMTAVAGFSDLAGALSSGASEVNLRWSDVVRATQEAGLAAKLSSYDPTKVVPISVRVLGTSLGPLENHAVLEIYDNSKPPKPLFTNWLNKHNNADSHHNTGFPLFMLAKGRDKILIQPPQLTDSHSQYWHCDLGQLEQGTSDFVNPATGERFKIVRRDSRAAALLDYALSVRNRVVCNPRLLLNPQYVLQDSPELLRIPLKMFSDVKSAYAAKLSDVNSQSYDFSNLKIHLKVSGLGGLWGVSPQFYPPLLTRSRSRGGCGGLAPQAAQAQPSPVHGQGCRGPRGARGAGAHAAARQRRRQRVFVAAPHSGCRERLQRFRAVTRNTKARVYQNTRVVPTCCVCARLVFVQCDVCSTRMMSCRGALAGAR